MYVFVVVFSCRELNKEEKKKKIHTVLLGSCTSIQTGWFVHSRVYRVTWLSVIAVLHLSLGNLVFKM